jgi:TM2 domain-containing membrane protein YozV
MTTAACPYCRAAIEQDDPQLVVCPGCGTPHHADCFEENGGCTIFGCTAAPPAEPKLSIGVPDLNATGTIAATPQATSAAPPPPPFMGPGTALAAPPPLIGSAAIATPSFVPPSGPMFSSLGYGSPNPVHYAAPQPPNIVNDWSLDPGLLQKNRTTFLLLGVLLGAFGAHSFYAGSTKKGLLQLAITVLTLGMAGIMVWIWAVIDICTISTDNDGIPFRN